MTWQADLAARARAAMPDPLWTYVQSGARDGVTAAEAEAAWHDLRFAPRVLTGPRAGDTTATLLGEHLATPIGIAPTSLQRVAHPDGERAMARAARDAGALHVVSSNAGFRFADLAAGAPWWLQLYLPPERRAALPVVAAAADAGATALVLTVDTPFPGTKYRPAEADWETIDLTWFRCNFEQPTGDVRWADDLVPDDIGWLEEQTGLPVVVKGVMRPDDARRCAAAGAAAVWVSNHGGRQLDRSATTRAVLPGVAAELAGAVPVYVDGGIRSGLDVLAALALGATGVFVGRPPFHALAAGGEAGVRELLQRLTVELSEALRLAGCRSLADVPDLLWPTPP